MAHVAAADPRADDQAVPVIVADAPGQDLLLAAVHGAQEETGAAGRGGGHVLFSDTSASATQSALARLRTNGHEGQ
eukprot:12490162-Alexandrium_andersonii.AAC.1